ncbi:MAG: BamA/TamA family outer membrane protein [Acidobacteria bacterium]|nr:BamA/TamA family outer membrane protein [Acidobacteriota bacterium]
MSKGARILVLLCLVPAALAGAQESRSDTVEIAEIRIHGNYDMPDADVLAAAGVAVGDRVARTEIDAIEQRLLDDGRFGAASAEWRFRSLTRRDQATLLLTIQESTSAARKVLFLPEIRYNEDEKFSAGARASVKDLFGGGTLISVPVLIGGLDRAAVEVSRRWDSGVGVGGEFQWRQFTNPFADVKDERTGGGLWFDRRFGSALSLRLEGDYHDVEFGGVEDTLVRYGAGLTFDTRPSRAFAYESVLLSASWQRVEPDSISAANRYRLEAAAYKTLVGQVVLAARGVLHTADAPLPAYERPFVGGMNSLRGTKAGTFSGDSTAQGTVELRIPITSVMTGSIARVGLVAFWDTAATWDHGESMGDQPFHHGVGGGVYLQAPLVRLNLDVGNNLEGDTRVHVGLGFRF